MDFFWHEVVTPTPTTRNKMKEKRVMMPNEPKLSHAYSSFEVEPS